MVDTQSVPIPQGDAAKSPDLYLAHELGQTLKYGIDPFSKHVHAWRGSVWEPVPDGALEMEIAGRIENDWIKFSPDALTSKVRKDFPKTFRAWLDYAGMNLKPPDFGTLPFRNGTIRVIHDEITTTTQTNPPQRDDNATFRLDYDYPEHPMPTPLFNEFLAFCVDGKDEWIDYLWWVVGQILWRPNTRQHLFLFHGIAGSGKSSLLRLLSLLMGPYCARLSQIGLWTGRFPYGNIPGKRLLTLDELRPNQFSEQALNELTSGVPVQVERKYRDPFDYEYRGHVVATANEVPDLKNQGFRRRLLPVRFTRSATREGINEDDIAMKIFKAEGGAIARESILKVALDMSDMPEDMYEDAEEVRLGSDAFAQWLEEDVAQVEYEDMFTPMKELYESYSKAAGSSAVGIETFRKKISAAGTKRAGRARKVRWGLVII